MKRATVVLLPLVGAVIVWMNTRAADLQTQDTMQAKLAYSKNVLEGIVTENFALIESNAQKLSALSQSVDWKVRQSAEFQDHTREFTRQTRALEKAAQGKNIDGATLAYFQMTMSCVSCHRHLRGTEQAGLPTRETSRELIARLAEAALQQPDVRDRPIPGT